MSSKVERNDSKPNKSMSGFSLSDSSSINSSKSNWKRAILEDGTLFFAKFGRKTDSNAAGQKSTTNTSDPKSVFKLSTVKSESVKELILTVNSLDRYRFGRRSSIVESMLGFGVVPFADNVECLMVSNIIDSSVQMEPPYIKEGDWFKSLDNIEIRTGNIDKLLLQYNRPTKVKLVLKGSRQANEAAEDNLREISNFNDFFHSYKRTFQHETEFVEQDPSIFLTLIVNREYFKVDNTDCMFYYPFIPNNFLFKSRGSFLTLDSVISNDLRSRPVQSTLSINSTKYYITYGYVDSSLVVCAFSSRFQTQSAAESNGNDFVGFLKFNISDFRSPQLRQYLTQVCDIFAINIKKNSDVCGYSLNLGSCLSSSLCIALPKEAQLRIYDALSELESMDYKKLCDSREPPQRLIISGTALYYKKYLLVSNLNVVLRTDVERFLRMRGITDFVPIKNVRKLYSWEKIYQDTQNEQFLAVCMFNSLLLVVVLRSTAPATSIFSCIPYIEEITDTLDYLVSSGIESISQFWLDSNKRPYLNLSKASPQMRHKFKFMQVKDIPSENTDGSYPQCESPPHSLSQSDEGNKRKSELESAFDWQAFGSRNDFKEAEPNVQYIEPLMNEVKNMMPLNLTRGWSNELKFFLHLNHADGKVMQPFKTMCSNAQLNVVKEYILVIHKLLQSNSNLKRFDEKASSLDKSIIVVKEHSIAVDVVNSSGDKETIVIVGRLFSFPLKEVYVCFGQNVSENLVELLFRMAALSIG